MPKWFDGAPVRPELPARVRWWIEQPQINPSWTEGDDPEYEPLYTRYNADRVPYDQVPGLCTDAPPDIREDAKRYAWDTGRYYHEIDRWWASQPLQKRSDGTMRLFGGERFTHGDVNALGFRLVDYLGMAHDGAQEATLRAEASRFYDALDTYRSAQAMLRKPGCEPWEDGEEAFEEAFRLAVSS